MGSSGRGLFLIGGQGKLLGGENILADASSDKEPALQRPRRAARVEEMATAMRALKDRESV